MGQKKITVVNNKEKSVKKPVKIKVEKKVKSSVEKILPDKKKNKIKGQKYKKVEKLIKNKEYSLDTALSLLKEVSFTSFEGTAEVHLTVKSVRPSWTVDFPYDRGKKKTIAVADDKETLEKIKRGEIDFDILLASPKIMPKLASYGRVLGPRGLMPNSKNGTLVADPKKAMEKMRKGAAAIIYSEKKSPLVHTFFGKVNQEKKELEGNLLALMAAIGQRNIKKLAICATMSPAIRVKLTLQK